MRHSPHARALRRGRISEAGRIYLVTTTTRHRRHVFADFNVARVLVRCLKTEHVHGRAFTIAYVVMPDHLHWLLEFGPQGSLSTVVRAVKSVTAHRLGYAIWQDGFHDHALRCEEDLQELARYVVANPLRAGMVERIGDYPHWDAVWL